MKLYIKNFQGISEAEINLNGFTVLTGRSNSGKSSIRRAIELVLYNRWDAGFIKAGESMCVVKLTIDDNNYIQITKPENTYTVVVNGVKSVYPKVAKNQLEELYDLGLDYFYDSEGYSHNVHIRRQIDPWYYITSSNQEQSRIIASIFNFDEIKNILKKSYKDKTEVTSQADKLAEDIDNLKLEGQDLSSKLTILNRLKTKLEEQEILERHLKLEDNISSKSKQIVSVEARVGKIDDIINKLYELNILKYHLTLEKELLTLSSNINLKISTESELSYKIKLAKSIRENLYQQDILGSYCNDVEKAIKLSERRSKLNKVLSSTIEKIGIAKNLRDNLLNKTILENYLKSVATLNTSTIDYNFLVSKLKQLVKVKNSLTRFSSLKGYLVSKNKLNDKKEELKYLTAKSKFVVSIIDKINLFSILNNYCSQSEKITKSSGVVSELKKEVKRVTVSINEAKEVINQSISCPHCSKPIGDFVERCTK